MILNNILKEIV